jgi:hypothetical protein
MGRTIAILISAIVFSIIGFLAAYLGMELPPEGSTAWPRRDEVIVARLAAPAIGAGIGLFIGVIAAMFTRRDAN